MISEDKIQYYMGIAMAVSRKSTCLRRKYGAIIVKNDEIISTGYNGSPRGVVNCNDIGKCVRQEANIEHGTRYELCNAVHAEQNAIISAPRRDMIDSVMYVYGTDMSTGNLVNGVPCSICLKMIMNSGIKCVYYTDVNGDVLILDIELCKNVYNDNTYAALNNTSVLDDQKIEEVE